MADQITDTIPLTLRQRVLKRKTSLLSDRSGWDKRWQQISDVLMPFSGRWVSSNRNQGTQSFNKIIDAEATKALRILAAGLMSGMTSPARPWFRLATPDSSMMEHEPVQIWLADVAQLMREVFHAGNTYRSLHTIYEELGAFGTAFNIIEPDYENVIWHTPLTIGEFALATNHKGQVNTVVRTFELTVEQIVTEFVAGGSLDGKANWSAVSPSIKNLWDSHNYDKGIEVVHLIEPRRLHERDLSDGYSRRLPKNMPFRSCYIEAAAENDKNVLREGGYRQFPGLGVRWHTRGGDVYGVGPGMEALGAVQQLQQEQFRKAQGIDYLSRPPIILPGEMKGREVDTLPGGVNYFSMSNPAAKASNLFDVRLDLAHLINSIEDVRKQINSQFYADLFLMISQDNRATPATATEVAERHEEKMLMLGPVLERLHDELLKPLIDITFQNLVDGGALPPPPPELEDVDLKVEFVSVLAQAQRAVGLGAIDRFLGTVGNLAAASQDPGVWDNVDKDFMVAEYADMLAINPKATVPAEQRDQARAAKAQQAQVQQLAEAAPGLAQAAKAGAEAQEISAGNPAGSIEQFSGYTP